MAFASVKTNDKVLSNPVNWRLYHLIELEQPVTARQVQWTFRKVTLRHHFHQAFLVLSNSDRKSLYDILGEDVVGFILSGNWGPLITCLGASKTIGLYCGSMMLATLLLILFFALLGMRVDESITWPWLYVMVPLLVFVVCMFIITAVALVISMISKVSKEEGVTYVDRIPAFGNFIAALCYLIFCFLIAGQIKNDATNYTEEYSKYFIIPIVADIFYYLSSLVWRWPRRIRRQMEVDMNHPNPLLCCGFFIFAFMYIIISIAQWLLIGKKIDESISHSWYVVLIPFCFRAAFRVIEAFMRSMVKRTIGVRTPLGVAFDTIGSFFTNGSLLASLYFAAVRISYGPAVYPMVYALIPVYIILAYIFCALIITAVYLASRNTENERQERLQNLKWTPEERTTGSRSGGFVFDEPVKEAYWDDIEDDDEPSDVFPEEMGRDPHNDFGAKRRRDFSGAPRVTSPYGVSVQPDEDAPIRRHWKRTLRSGSRTPSGTVSKTMTGTASESTSGEDSTEGTERPARYHDPYAPRTDATPVRHTPPRGDTGSADYSSDDDEEDYGDYEEGEDDVETESDVSSSATSSVVFSSGNPTPRR